MLSGFIGFAGKALQLEDVTKAAQLYGVVESFLKLTGYTLWNETRRMNSWVVSELAKVEDQNLIEIEKRTGAGLSVEQAIRLAIE